MAVQIRNDELIDILSADFLRCRLPLAVYDTFGGFMEINLAAVDDTTITLLGASNPFAVTAILRTQAVCATSGGATGVSDGNTTPSGSLELYNDGDTIIELRVTAAGAVEVQRIGGAATVNLKLRLDWI